MSCYKIMLFIGINDMVAITVNSIITGYSLIVGVVYCAEPNFQYFAGAIGLATWCSACLACLILVFNRICALWKPTLVEAIFGGNKAYFIMGFPLVYCMWFIFCTPPILFSSPREGWFLYPFFEDAQKFFTESEWKKLQVVQDMVPYANLGMMANNILVVFLTVIFYIIFCLILLFKFYNKTSQKKTFAQKSIFYQSALISAANLYTAAVYTYMQFFPVPATMVFIGHAGCMFSHGFPAMVYLTVNRSIRMQVAGMLGFSKYGGRRISQFRSTDQSMPSSDIRPDQIHPRFSQVDSAN
ncbi:unnamed protein product, partial [Mesorhabditis spiculigera]